MQPFCEEQLSKLSKLFEFLQTIQNVYYEVLKLWKGALQVK